MRRRIALALVALALAVVLGVAGFFLLQGRDGWKFAATDGASDGGVLGRAWGLQADETWTRDARAPHVVSGLYSGEVPAGAVLVLEFTTSHQARVTVDVVDRDAGAPVSAACGAGPAPTQEARPTASVDVRVEPRADGCRFTLTFLRDVDNPTGATLVWRASDFDPEMRPWTLAFRAS